MSANGTAPGSEWPILLIACSVVSQSEKLNRLELLLRGPVQWASLFALAERHGTQALLYEVLNGVQGLVRDSDMRGLQQAFQTNLRRNLLLSRELIRITDHLSAAGLEVMPYKGIALAETLYGDMALRQAGDIDLLIRPEDLPAIREALGTLAYSPHTRLSDRQEKEYLRSGYECAFDGPAGRNMLEVQWAFQPHFYAVDFDVHEVFTRAIIVEVAGQPRKIPCYSDQFLTLSVHAAKHVWGRLIWLCDIARLMNLPNLDWECIGSQAKQLGIVRILRVTIQLAHQLLGVEVPADANHNLSRDFEEKGLVEEVQQSIVSDVGFEPETVSYFRLMLRLRERPADRFRFLSRLVFTPGQSEWQAVSLPAPLFPLYRLVRLSRLAARFLRS